MNVADIIALSARNFASNPICVFDGKSTSYEDLIGSVRRLATALKAKGARAGTRVVLLAQNRPEWLASFFAILATGATAVPINPGLAPPEIEKIVHHCEPAITIVQADLAHLFDRQSAATFLCVLGPGGDSPWHRLTEASATIDSYCRMQPGDPALIFYTSGTTGTPKGVVLSHGALLFAARMFSSHLRISPSDRSLVTGSMAFVLHLLLNALSSVYGGASLVMLERFHPELAVRAIEAYRITLLMAVPTAYVMMLNWMAGRPYNVSSIRHAITAGASFPAALYQRARDGFGFPVFDLWGMTECAPTTTYDPAVDKEGRPDSCGRPLPGCAVRIVDDELNNLPTGEVGEVLLRGPAMMTGYYKNQGATAETIVSGWVRSGDLGRVDAEGFLYIVGRKKDMIVRGGANIYPVDIEEVLYAHEAVGECAVVGAPDPTFGETVKAFIVLKGGKDASAEDIVEHCRRHIADYKVPAEIAFVDSLPKGATGKILRRELREDRTTR